MPAAPPVLPPWPLAPSAGKKNVTPLQQQDDHRSLWPPPRVLLFSLAFVQGNVPVVEELPCNEPIAGRRDGVGERHEGVTCLLEKRGGAVCTLGSCS